MAAQGRYRVCIRQSEMIDQHESFDGDRVVIFFEALGKENLQYAYHNLFFFTG